MRKAESQSAKLSTAYETLRNPHARAQYMLELLGEYVTRSDVPPDLLLEMLDKTERIPECSKQELQEMHEENENRLQETGKELELFFRNKQADKARAAVARLNYFMRLRTAIDDEMEQRLHKT